VVYTFLKKIITASLVVFYRSIVVEGKENIPKNGPLIIAANHPNTFMDPLLIAAFVRQRVGFLANGGIFKNKMLAAFLNYLHVIPIFRKKDINPGEVANNQKYFNKTVKYLNGKGTFMIFPEGSSFYEFKLREIKTGTARIAFQFQEENEFNKGLKIMTVALNYSDAIKFRSKVMITFNEPIEIDEYKDLYEEDSEKAVRAVTRKIEEELSEQLVIADTPEKEALLRRIQKIYADYWLEDKRFKAKDKAEMEIRIALSKAIAYFADYLPNEYSEIEQKVDAYFDKAESVRVTQNLISGAYVGSNATSVLIQYFLALILGFPFFLLGYITHVLPVAISQYISKVPKDIEYRAPLLMGVATFLIPLFYFLEIYWFDKVFENTLNTIIFGISLPICGAFVWLYRTFFIRFKKLKTFLKIQRKDPDYVEHLKTERESILQTLKEAQNLYSLQAEK
jgi:glycerol-3-phosphate O-acyltransferase/dihydroxyacetone phosphate acyltransferase